MKILQSKLAVFFLLIFLSFILFSLGRAVYRKYQINQEIDKMQAEIARIEGENQKMMDIIDYFKTDEFLEKEVREKLNMAREGEKVMVVPPLAEKEESAVEDQSAVKNQTENMSNTKKWWNYFFGKDKVLPVEN